MTTTKVQAKNLKPGMILVDPMTGQSAFEIDHKMHAVRGSGDVRYFGLDYEDRRYSEIGLRPSLMVEVVA
jgi:hypothetical protein